MNLLRKFACAGPAAVLFLLFAAPAFAQFEVNPDHFDNQPPSTQKTAQVKKTSQRQHASRKPAALNPQAKTNLATANGDAGSAQHAPNAGANPPHTMQTASADAKPRTRRKPKSVPAQLLNRQASAVLRE